mgnify:CR=1 FL=1|jgi:hypothetical protein|tara:strand:+ start:957 stop:1538 length:582 start_codon:yes stop_codon:yes gene_type:complete
MALPGSGAISLSAIASEFGDSTPNSISEFYRGGSLVPNAAINNSVPTSGAISFDDFYGASDQLWTTTITVGSKNIEIFGTLVAVLYGFADNSVYNPGTGFGSFGSASDSTVDFYSGAALAGLYTRDGSSNTFGLDVGGTQSNSGWSTMTVGSTSLNRTDASFSVGNGVSSWSWTLSGDANPMGTSGTTVVTFV